MGQIDIREFLLYIKKREGEFLGTKGINNQKDVFEGMFFFGREGLIIHIHKLRID